VPALGKGCSLYYVLVLLLFEKEREIVRTLSLVVGILNRKSNEKGDV